MTNANGHSAIVRPPPSHWLVQLARLGNMIAASAVAYLLFLVLYPDRIAMAAMFGGLLGGTLALGEFAHRPERIISWNRLFACIAILDGMAVFLGLVALLPYAVAGPFVDVRWDFWLSFGVAAVVMSFMSIPVVSRFSARPAMLSDPDKAAGGPAA